MATHCSTLAWRISWMEEPGRLQSTGLQSRTGLSGLHVTDTFYKWNHITHDRLLSPSTMSPVRIVAT